MTRGERVRRVLIIATVILLAGVPVSADAAGPYIQLKDSTIIAGCEIKVHRALQSIMLFCGSEEKRVRFNDVLKIVDSTGTDVTDDYIGRYDVLGIVEEEEESEDSLGGGGENRIRRETERLFDVALSGQVLLRPHVDSYHSGIDPGLGVDVSGLFTIAQSAGIRIAISYCRAGIDGSSKKYKVTQFTGGIQVFNGKSRRRSGAGIFYAYSGLGVTHESPSARTRTMYSYSYRTGSGTRFTISNGLGWMQVFDDRLGMDASFGFDLLFLGHEQTSRAVQIELRLGLIGLIGGY